MAAILGITFPIYAAIAIGYLTVRLGLFSCADIEVLSRFVVNLALPALLFVAVASRGIEPGPGTDYMLRYLLGGLATLALGFLVFSLFSGDPLRRAIGAMGCTCPNNNFVGYPVMLLAYPGLAPTVLSLNVLVEATVLIPSSLILIELAAGGGGPILPRIGRILWTMLKMPLMIGLLAGIAVSLTGLPVPSPAERLLELFATATMAVALVVIGGSLVGVPMREAGQMAVLVTLGKTLVHPAMVALALILLGPGGMPLELRQAMILSAAMPVLGIYPVFAARHGYGGRAAVALLGTTAASFVTLNLLLWFFA